MKKKSLAAKAKKTSGGKTVDPDLAQLGNRFRAIHKKLGYTSYETFAYEHEFSRITYGKMETGQNVTYKSLLKFVRAADIIRGILFRRILISYKLFKIEPPARKDWRLRL